MVGEGSGLVGPLCWPEGILRVLSWHSEQALGRHLGQRGPEVRASPQVVTVLSPGRGSQESFWVGGES